MSVSAGTGTPEPELTPEGKKTEKKTLQTPTLRDLDITDSLAAALTARTRTSPPGSNAEADSPNSSADLEVKMLLAVLPPVLSGRDVAIWFEKSAADSAVTASVAACIDFVMKRRRKAGRESNDDVPGTNSDHLRERTRAVVLADERLLVAACAERAEELVGEMDLQQDLCGNDSDSEGNKQQQQQQQQGLDWLVSLGGKGVAKSELQKQVDILVQGNTSLVFSTPGRMKKLQVAGGVDSNRFKSSSDDGLGEENKKKKKRDVEFVCVLGAGRMLKNGSMRMELMDVLQSFVLGEKVQVCCFVRKGEVESEKLAEMFGKMGRSSYVSIF